MFKHVGLIPRIHVKLGVEIDTYETSSGEVETDRSLGFPGQPLLVSELQAHERPCLKNKVFNS